MRSAARILASLSTAFAVLLGCVPITARAQAASTPPTLRGARIGFYAVDLASGVTITDRNADADFLPASTLKLIAGSMALDTLPSSFTFITRMYYSGNIRQDGVLNGNIYVQGGGDPTFDDAALRDAAAAIAAAGIRRIAGFIALDSSRYSGPRYPPGWSIDDLPYDYNAPITALSLDDNISNATLDFAAQSPNAFFFAAFRAALLAAQVTTGSILQREGVPLGAHLLWTRNSPGLSTLLPNFWLPSNNFYGEMFVNEFGARTPGIGTTLDRGLNAATAWLQSLGIDPATLTLADGSGLSEYDRVTPRALVTILQHDWNGTHRAAILAALPQAGVSGTLVNTFVNTPLQRIVIAKTGSMNHTRTLAGYLLTPTRSIAFALLINDWMDTAPGASERLNAARASMLETLLPLNAQETHPLPLGKRSRGVWR